MIYRSTTMRAIARVPLRVCVVAVVASVACSIVACSPTSQKVGEAVPWSAVPPQPTAVALGARTVQSLTPLPATAPDFALQTIDGQSFRMSKQKGRVVGLWVMASWCDTCIPETRAWDRLATEFGSSGLTVVAVSGDPGDTADDVRRFAALANVSHPVWLLDPNAEFVALFQVRMLDTTMIFERTGQVAYRNAISIPYDVLRREVEKVL